MPRGKRGPRQDAPELTSLKGGKGAGRKAAARKDPAPQTAGSPDMPNWRGFGWEAQAVWRRILPIMESRATISPDNRDILAAFCLAVQHLRRATALLQKDGLTQKAPSGYKQAHPAVAMARSAREEVSKLGDKLGLNPVSREDIPSTLTEKQADAFDEWESLPG